MLVGRIVAADQVDIVFSWGILINVFKESERLLVSMASLVLNQYFTTGHIERGERQDRAVAYAIVGRTTP